MSNPFRNEKEIVLGGESILLRPTFENMMNMETKVGPLGHLALKLLNFQNNMKDLIGFSELVSIIYWNQAAHDKDFGKAPKSIREIYDLVAGEGLYATIPPIAGYLAKVANGNKVVDMAAVSEKKS